MINYNTPKIDSLRLLIPLEDIQIQNHSEFNRIIYKSNSDGELLEEKKCTMYRQHLNPCSALYQLGTMVNNGISYSVLKIGFSSKTLKEDYFTGINKENIQDIVNFINSEGIIKVKLETLLNSWVVDVDICMDLKLNQATIKQVVDISNQLTIKYKETAIEPFRDAKNRGIEWSHRNKVGKAYKTKQFLKFYAKALELKYNSTIFYETYIKDTPIEKELIDDKLLRVETTIKNKAHFQTYGITINNLGDLLNLDLNKYLEIFNRPINHYMTGYKPIKTMTKLSPSDKIYLDLINTKMELLDLSKDEAIELISTDNTNTKQAKYRIKNKLEDLTNKYRVELKEMSDKNQLDIITELEKQKLIPKFQ